MSGLAFLVVVELRVHVETEPSLVVLLGTRFAHPLELALVEVVVLMGLSLALSQQLLLLFPVDLHGLVPVLLQLADQLQDGRPLLFDQPLGEPVDQLRQRLFQSLHQQMGLGKEELYVGEQVESTVEVVLLAGQHGLHHSNQVLGEDVLGGQLLVLLRPVVMQLLEQELLKHQGYFGVEQPEGV